MSKQGHSLRDESFVASGEVTKYRAVGFDGAQITVQGSKVAGVAKEDAADGEMFPAGVIGSVVIESGAAIALGEGLIAGVQGRAIPTTGEVGVAAGGTAVTSTAVNGNILTGGEMPEYVFADALQAAVGAGEFIEVLLRR